MQYSENHIPLQPNELIKDFLPFAMPLFLPAINSPTLISMNAHEKQKLYLAGDLHDSFQLKISIDDGKYVVEPNIFEIASFGVKPPTVAEERLLCFIRSAKTLETEPKIAFSFIQAKRSYHHMEPKIQYKYKDGCINAVKRDVHLSYFL